MSDVRRYFKACGKAPFAFTIVDFMPRSDLHVPVHTLAIWINISNKVKVGEEKLYKVY